MVFGAPRSALVENASFSIYVGGKVNDKSSCGSPAYYFYIYKDKRFLAKLKIDISHIALLSIMTLFVFGTAVNKVLVNLVLIEICTRIFSLRTP